MLIFYVDFHPEDFRTQDSISKKLLFIQKSVKKIKEEITEKKLKVQTPVRKDRSPSPQSQFVIQPMAHMPRKRKRKKNRRSTSPNPPLTTIETNYEDIEYEEEKKSLEKRYKGVYRENKALREKMKEREEMLKEVSNQMENIINNRKLENDYNNHEIVKSLEKENERLKSQSENYVNF